jgi:hypothetical protein
MVSCQRFLEISMKRFKPALTALHPKKTSDLNIIPKIRSQGFWTSIQSHYTKVYLVFMVNCLIHGDKIETWDNVITK